MAIRELFEGARRASLAATGVVFSVHLACFPGTGLSLACDGLSDGAVCLAWVPPLLAFRLVSPAGRHRKVGRILLLILAGLLMVFAGLFAASTWFGAGERGAVLLRAEDFGDGSRIALRRRDAGALGATDLIRQERLVGFGVFRRHRVLHTSRWGSVRSLAVDRRRRMVCITLTRWRGAAMVDGRSSSRRAICDRAANRGCGQAEFGHPWVRGGERGPEGPSRRIEEVPVKPMAARRGSTA